MSFTETLNKITLSRTDRMIFGVCGSLAKATDTPAWVWRAGFVIATIFAGVSILIYLILWFFMARPGDIV